MHRGMRTTVPSARHPTDAGPSEEGGKGKGRDHADGRGPAGVRRRGGRSRVLSGLALLTSIVILGTAAGGRLYYGHLNDSIRKGERSSGSGGAEKTGPNAAGQTPLNILLLGSDSRANEADAELGGGRADRNRPPLADVQMLLHISADRSNASLVSIPRDTRVDIPRCEDPRTGRVYPPVNAIINESLARGGPGCTLATWEKLTGIYIDHWMMVDFSGVVSMADAVGGVEVCVRQNVWDRDLRTGKGGSGLKLKAGRQRIRGETALQWLRTRYAFGSDMGRTRAQHMYLSSMLRKLRSQNVFTDTGSLMSLAEAATRAVTVDEGLGSVRRLFDLAMEFKSIPADRITTAVMPSVPDPLNPGAHLVPKPGEAQRLFAMVRHDIPFDANGKRKPPGTAGGGKAADKDRSLPPASPRSEIPVTVLNGTGTDSSPPVPGRATAVADHLAASGFTRAVAGNSPRGQKTTTLRHPVGEQSRADALAVAELLGLPRSAVKESAETGSVTLVVGADWPKGTDYRAAPPGREAVPESANPLNGGDTGACMDVYRPYVW